MSGLDVIIRGGTVVTASDTFQCDVGIRDGRVAVLGQEPGPAGKVIGATGKLVLPVASTAMSISPNPPAPISSWRTISKAARGPPRSAATRRCCHSAFRKRAIHCVKP